MKITNIQVCMVTYSDYEADIRVRREAEALVNEGYWVDIICLPSENRKKKYILNDVRVYPITKFLFFSHRNKLISFLYRYLIFGILMFFKLIQLSISNKYRIVHVHNPPDPFVFFVLPIKLVYRMKIILDRHEPLYLGVQSLFGVDSKSGIIRIIKILENLSFRMSNKIIVINDVEYEDILARGVKKEKLHVLTNTIDEARITLPDDLSCKELRNKTRCNDNCVIFIYQGLIAKERDLDTLIESAKSIYFDSKVSNFHILICGDGPFLLEVKETVKKYGMKDFFSFTGKIPFEELLINICCSDVGLVLAKDNEFYKRYSPNKLFEYYYFKKLVIASKVENLVRIAGSSCMFVNSGDCIDLSDNMIDAIKNLKRIKEEKKDSMDKIYKKYSWISIKKELFNCYKQIYD